MVQDQGGSEDLVYHKYLRPLTVLEFTVYGMPLIYNGQEIQYKSGGEISLAEKTPIDWSKPDKEMESLIKTLIHLKHTQRALRTGKESGSLTNLTTTADDAVYAYKRTLGQDNIVVMLNFSDAPRTFKVPEGLPKGKYKDALTGNEVRMKGSVQFTLPAFGAAVYVKD